MSNVIDLTPLIASRNPRGQYLARIDAAIDECSELLCLGRWYQKETVPELERALAGLMKVRARLVESERREAK